MSRAPAFAVLSPISSTDSLKLGLQGVGVRGTSFQPVTTRNSHISVAPTHTRAKLQCLVEAPLAKDDVRALSTRVLENKLLAQVATCDGGPTTSAAERTAIDTLILELCERGKTQLPMLDPQLFNRYCVAYTSTTEKSAPAGGLFRGKLGRVIFRARGIFQHVLRPSTVVNVIPFKLLGVLFGAVALRGKLRALDGTDFGPNGIGVVFEPPRLMLGGIVFQFAKKSSVKLRTPYLSSRLRIGIGSRGSLFAFTRGGNADKSTAREWEVMFGSRTPVLPLALVPLTVIALVVTAVLASWRVAAFALAAVLAVAYSLKANFDPSPFV
jgi:hypothetical protein